MESATAPGQTQAGAGGNRTSTSQAFIFSGSNSHKGFWMTIGY